MRWWGRGTGAAAEFAIDGGGSSFASSRGTNCVWASGRRRLCSRARSFLTLGLVHVRRARIPREKPNIFPPLRAHDPRSCRKNNRDGTLVFIPDGRFGTVTSRLPVRIFSFSGSACVAHAHLLVPEGNPREQAAWLPLSVSPHVTIPICHWPLKKNR
jgi:hypothetical protein